MEQLIFSLRYVLKKFNLLQFFCFLDIFYPRFFYFFSFLKFIFVCFVFGEGTILHLHMSFSIFTNYLFYVLIINSDLPL